MNHKLLYIIILLFALGCENIEYNPNEIILKSADQETIAKNISTLSNNKNSNDTIRFVVMGDAQRWYDEATELTSQINKLKNIDFVIQTGDLTDFGLLQEYNWMKEILDQLDVPYFPVIGNHDLVANGGGVYKEMFGDYNFSFVFGNTKFVFLNTNSLEFGFHAPVPNLNWLEQEIALTEDYENVFLTMHVPPMSMEFNPELKDDFKNELNNNQQLIGVLHGHTHNFQVTEDFLENISLVGADAVEKRTYLLYTIVGQNISYEKIPF
jgi:3',5'-cyclic-AMP phosphodiesterase